LISQGTLPWQPNLLVLVHGCRQAAGGTAGRVNVGLCLAFSFAMVSTILGLILESPVLSTLVFSYTVI